MKFYSYSPQTTPGPNGSATRYTDTDPGTLTEVGTHNNRAIVIAPDAAVIPDQPSAIDWQPQPINAEFTAWFSATRYASLLADARERKRSARLQAMETAREQGFEYNGYTVASDTRSQILILGTANRARAALADGSQAALDAFSATLGDGWRATTGTVVATDAAAIIAMETALGIHIATCDAIGQTKKAAIEAAETLVDLQAIDVTAGYTGT